MNFDILNLNDVFKILLDFLKVILSWPTAMLILGILFLLKYSDVIRQFVSNLGIKTELPGGLKLDIYSRQQDQVKKVFDLEGTKLQGEDDIETIKKQLEETRKYWLFDNTFNLIYGSQIRLLEHLSRKASSGDSFQSLYSFFYDSSCKVYPVLRSYPFVNYINFLESRQLVKKEDDIYTITKLGIEFLNYIDVNMYLKNKAF